MARIETLGGSHPWRSLRTLTVVCGGLSIFWLTSACQTSCGNGNQQPTKYVDGKIHTNGFQRIYESTPKDGEWLHFPSYRRFQFVHELGTMDYTPFMLVAFDSHPIPLDGDAGDVAIASGDVAIVENFDSHTFQVRNDTCSEQYLYVRLTASDATRSTDADGGATQ